jgi:hypothetical protein
MPTAPSTPTKRNLPRKLIERPTSLPNVVMNPGKLPAWMFSKPYLDRLVALYRKTAREDNAKHQRAQRLIADDEHPLLADLILEQNQKWLFANYPPEKHRHLKSSDDAARQRTADTEMRWRIISGHRVRLVAAFTGLSYVAFSFQVGLRVHKGRATVMSQLATGESAISFDQLAAVERLYGIDPRWYIMDHFWDSPLEKQRHSVAEEKGLLKRPEDVRRVVCGEVRLLDLGVQVNIPSWADPYFLVRSCRQRVVTSTSTTSEWRSCIPGLEEPPEGIPRCTWREVLAEAEVDPRTGIYTGSARGKRKATAIA